MNRLSDTVKYSLQTLLSIVTLALLSYPAIAMAKTETLTLSGKMEVPPVMSKASATANLTIGQNHVIEGKLSLHGIKATAAHIHEGAMGTSGPIIVPFYETSPETWVLPDGVKLTDAQYRDLEAGKLYVNVHTRAHPGGELRAQLKP